MEKSASALQVATKVRRRGGYIAEPRVHLGNVYEIDVCAFDEYGARLESLARDQGDGGGATMILAPPEPSPAVETEFPDEYAYEVLVFDLERERELVAAIEIVSPANKDRPSSRQMFVAKCLNLLQKGVCVSIVDLVTNSRFNLYRELLELKRRRDANFPDDTHCAYAATCRTVAIGNKTRFDTWSYPLAVGKALPELPIWLNEKQHVMLDLEASYEAACRTFRIG